MQQFVIALANPDAKGFASGGYLDVFHLRTGRVIQRNRCVHDDSVDAAECQVHVWVHLSVIAADRDTSKTLEVFLSEGDFERSCGMSPKIFRPPDPRFVQPQSQRERGVEVRV
ncbi:MAG: hypothetical protein DMG12_25290 [Acidobacteria bacterium]|nr:MAG: hypothetical protein DMG12_25290 [Acidobacteriota bacterium]